MPDGTRAISLDSILLAVLVISNIVLFEGYLFQKSFYIGLLLLYMILDFLSNTSSQTQLVTGTNFAKFCTRQKHVLLMLLILFIVVWPALSQIYVRHEEGLEYFAHDGLIQTEESVKFLLEGKNPYTEDYFGTPMENWNYFVYGVNPALYHLPYLPFLTLFAIPFHLISNALLGWFDLRFILIMLFIVLLAVLEKFSKDDSKRLQLLMVFSLNPWFSDFFDEGRNDIFILFWIVLAVYALKKNSILMSSVFMAFACLSKQTAWFLLPFYLAYLMKNNLNFNSLKEVLVKTYPLFLLSFVVITPFLLWDYSSFIDDVFSFHAGTSNISYPMGGYGIATLLVESGLIKQEGYFPFWTLQLLFGLPLLWLLLKKQQQQNTLKMMLVNYGLLTFAMLFLSISFHDNYLGYLICVLALAYFMDDSS